MIRCHFARLLGENKLKISDVAAATSINRGTLTRLYYETAERVDLEVLDKLCEFFDVPLDVLLERSTSKDLRGGGSKVTISYSRNGANLPPT